MLPSYSDRFGIEIVSEKFTISLDLHTAINSSH